MLRDVERTRDGRYLRKDRLERPLGEGVSSRLWAAVKKLVAPCLKSVLTLQGNE